MNQTITVEGEKIVIKRIFSAPVEKVYRAWTDAEMMSAWFVPNERWHAPVVELDLQPGGRYNIASRHTDGDVYHNVGHFVDIVPNERLSFTWTWLESPTGEEESLVTLEFKTVPGGTELTLIHDRLTDPTNREATRGGWAELFEVLDNVLNGRPKFGS